jgi:hypothetical protein
MGKITVGAMFPTSKAALEIMRVACERVTDERNNGAGAPAMQAVDLLTDAVEAYLAALRREALTSLAPLDADII